jgi:hypothetical protein
VFFFGTIPGLDTQVDVFDFSDEAYMFQSMQLRCYCFTLRFIKSSKRLLDRPCFWIHIECVLDEFIGNPWHVRRTPEEDFLVLTEELDECAFLCRIQVYCDGGCFCWVREMNPNFLGILDLVESLIWQGSTYVE